MPINVQPAKLRDEIVKEIQKAAPSESNLKEIGRQLLKHNADPAAEAIVESYYRCLLVAYLQTEYKIEREEVPRCINSSHRAPRLVCWYSPRHDHDSITPTSWKASWKEMRDRYTPIRKHETLRRADLYVIAQGKIVSVEFKHVGSHEVSGLNGCIQQMKRYADKHAATLMVIYSTAKAGSEVRGVAQIREALGPKTPVVVVYGPRCDEPASLVTARGVRWVEIPL